MPSRVRCACDAPLIIQQDTGLRVGSAGCLQGQFKRLWHGFAKRRHAVYIDDAVEKPLQTDHLQHAPGVLGISIGEDEFPGRDCLQDIPQFRVWMDVSIERYVVDKGKVVIHVHLVVGLQAAQCGAVFPKIFLPDGNHLVRWKAHAIGQVKSDAPGNGLP